ncbi:MAG TPA: PEP-CTERM sorting domain-containing protein [Isosphaeraceae bacterium]|nr:PEP-CTERM sorting domain-containing protein [Isosphaeraceae bacterium]
MAALGAAFAGSGRADAGMTLTADGIVQGFSLSTFADNFPSTSNIGPVGIGFAPGGNVLVTDYGSAAGTMYNFATDTDGQHAGPGLATATYGANNPTGIATLDGNLYMALQGSGAVYQINNDGTFRQVIATGIPTATDIVADPATGKLYVSALGSGIYVIDTTNKNQVSRLSTISTDGMSLSADGKTLYVANGGNLLAVSTATGLQTQYLGFISGLDGTALGTGTLAGNIFANTNGGSVVEVSLNTLNQTVIASGGSRGDLVKVDPHNGTLLLTQSDSILRLSPPTGGGFGNPAPEPSTLILAAVGGLTGLGARWRRRRPA